MNKLYKIASLSIILIASSISQQSHAMFASAARAAATVARRGATSVAEAGEAARLAGKSVERIVHEAQESGEAIKNMSNYFRIKEINLKQRAKKQQEAFQWLANMAKRTRQIYQGTLDKLSREALAQRLQAIRNRVGQVEFVKPDLKAIGRRANQAAEWATSGYKPVAAFGTVAVASPAYFYGAELVREVYAEEIAKLLAERAAVQDSGAVAPNAK